MTNQEETTKTYLVRAIRGFQHPLGHRRAGYNFMPGPEPQTVELTKSQYELIQTDPVLEFVDEENKALPDQTALVDPHTPGSPTTPGRSYVGDETPNPEENTPETAEQLSELGRSNLNAKASELGVEDPQKLGNKQEVVEAILAARAKADIRE